ncbi:MAG: isoprenylcysteine carboxylmethyltransferase family protein [Candidatus Marinimicrobia bacterium]|nr:isoprenylcysteine carboxylmethyltransferase family protein [Candidatus Neomarinimicrobiota bacterium]
MALREKFKKQGNWLFKRRSYLPLLIFPFLIIALFNYEHLESYLGKNFGDIYGVICIAISFLGLAIRAITIGYTPKGTSVRSTDGQVADTLNTTGMYSVVRHPLYLGNFITFLGMILFIQVWWFSIIGMLAFFIYYERIMYAEEAFLRKKFGKQYLEWAKETPAFWPKFRNWKKPKLRFLFRSVLKREYSGFFTIIISFTMIEFLGNLISKSKFELDLNWIIFFSVGVIIYLTLRTINKTSKILHVEGR